jgi:copper chaperone NosL
MKPARTVMGLAMLSIATLASCSREELAGPPELRLGRDECAECGMLVNEDRCSSGMLIDRSGYREHLLFDDIGCMLDHADAMPEGAVVVEMFVHDYHDRTWHSASTAAFLRVEDNAILTPMASGIVAFGTREAADAAHTSHGGAILDLDGISEARRAWLRSRRGAAAHRERLAHTLCRL